MSVSQVPTMALIGCGSRGREAYGAWLRARPDRGRVVAVADPDEAARTRAGEEHGVPEDRRFASWQSLLTEPRLADACIVATPDRHHVEPAVAALEQGYHLLLEKPVAVDEAGIDALEQAAAAAPELDVTVCHVLRYTPFFRTLQRAVASGEIGRLRLVEHAERIGHWHFAHSFVRGNWRREDEAAPMILAKACHDLDVILWLAGAQPTSLVSTGSLSWFHPGNAPEGAPPRCTDGCPVEESCPHSAPRIYLERFQAAPTWPGTVLTPEPTRESIETALREGPYGRCVFHCDNDVADQQGVLLELTGGVRAHLTVTAFSEACTREVRVQGTEGELFGDMERGTLQLTRFADGKTRELELAGSEAGGHGGGDAALMDDFTGRLARRKRGEPVGEALTALAVSIASHRLAFHAETSRREGGRPVELDGVG